MKKVILIISSCLVLVLLFVWGIMQGSFETNLVDLWNSVFHYDDENMAHFTIVQLRMPRVLMTFLIGGTLALSGYLMQLTINNPLAEPFILGTSSAASLGANLSFLGFIPLSILGMYMPGVMAFVFAIGATLLVILIAKRKGFVQGAKMLLAGIAMSSMLTSILSLLAFKTENTSQLRTIMFWVLGNFEHVKWSSIPFISVVLLVTTLLFTFMSRHINLLLMGKEKAEDLGLNVKQINRLTIFSAVLLASVSVTLVGAIGFVGLMIPHFTRAMLGVTNRWNILFSVVLGGMFLMACDGLSKWLYPPVGIPIGIITSFFGVPFFVYLLLKKNYSFD